MQLPPDLLPLFNVAAIGGVLAWFMFRSQARVSAMQSAIQRNLAALELCNRLTLAEELTPEEKALADARAEVESWFTEGANS